MSTKTYCGILWDLDGCLHPTTPQISAAYAHCVYLATQEFNLGLNQEECLAQKKLGFQRYGNTALHFEIEYNVPRWDFLAAMYRHIDIDLMQPYPGFEELLRANAHLPMGIVTSGTKPWSSGLLKKLELDGIIPSDRIITLEDTNGRTKSHSPDAYQLAAARLGIPTDQLIMIDDHTGNLITAKQQKLLTLLLDHSGMVQKEDHVDHVVTEPSQLFDLIHDGQIPWSGPVVIPRRF
jgi:FMN phosphatase YigB (HAD superfamily)